MQTLKLFFVVFAVLVRNICCNRAVAEILSLKNDQDSESEARIQTLNLQSKEGDLPCYNKVRSYAKKISSQQTKLQLTVKRSSINMKNAYDFQDFITAGVNTVIYAGLPIDYLFVFDKGKKVYREKRGTGWSENPEAFDRFDCIIQKFYGYFKKSQNFGPPIRQNSRGKLIEGSYVSNKPLPLNKDFGNYQFGGSVSTIFHALQFLLYIGISQIYLVGCDAGIGYAELQDHLFENHRNKKESKSMLKEWKVAYDFVNSEYKNVNVTILNPVGLKGIGWKEIYDAKEIFGQKISTD